MIMGIDSNNCLIIDTEASYQPITFDYVNMVKEFSGIKMNYQEILSFLNNLSKMKDSVKIPEEYKEKLKSLL